MKTSAYLAVPASIIGVTSPDGFSISKYGCSAKKTANDQGLNDLDAMEAAYAAMVGQAAVSMDAASEPRMTRDAEHTPYPQSVVVPLEDWQHVIGALKNAKARLPMGAAIGNVSDALSKVEHLQAAPAPSSLAGGDRKQFLCDVLCGVALDGNEPIGETADRILAALSPEAPAREGTAFAMNGLMTTHSTLRSANIARQNEWDQDNQISAAYRGNELAGEVGEACNVIKKLERERLGILGSRATIDELADELADVLICADLIAMHYGIDLEAAVAQKFNATSEKVGLQTRLAAPNDGGGS